ncbi:hypothetical protein [Dongia mobilis]|uniref:hypothetical protein n=1 Tax=Dongia sp. TaxID=1977262 RepID=UPI0026EE26FC
MHHSFRAALAGLFITLATVPLLVACQPQEGRVNLNADEKFVISKGTWDYYQKYLQAVDGGARGAFVVSEDGYYATYTYCRAAQACYQNINYSAEALKDCISDGYKCVVFAKDSDIVVDYAVAE